MPIIIKFSQRHHTTLLGRNLHMKRKMLVPLLASLTVIPMTVGTASATSTNGMNPNQQHLSVNKPQVSSSGLSLSWNGDADHYRVMEGNNTLYTGNAKTFTLPTQNNLDQDFLVDAYDANGNVIGKSFVIERGQHKNTGNSYAPDSTGKIELNRGSNGTWTVNHGIPLSNSTSASNSGGKVDDTSVNFVINPGSITMWWKPVPGVSTYTISRDGTVIGTTSSPEFTDSTTTADVIHTYRITGSAQDGTQVDMNATLNIGSSPGTGASASAISQVSAPATQSTLATAAASTSTNFLVRYTIFIPPAQVSAPLNPGGASIVPPYYWFEGDNRSFNANASSYRTRVDVGGTWDGSGNVSSLYFVPTAGETIGYDANWNVVGTGYANMSNVNLLDVTYGTWQIYYGVSHSASNPLVYGSPSVLYSYYMTLYSNGSYSAYGASNKAPNHELYVMYPNGITTVMQYTSTLNLWLLGDPGATLGGQNQWSNSYNYVPSV